ncbi:MAG: M48 family metallopeptidase [Cyclobacteriaceae bacterium]|nr:M48 family metallopeptidase [Cyclobacteriaceae bacterium]
MKPFIILLGSLCWGFSVQAQDLSETQWQQMIDYYNSTIGTFITYETCGHIFDGPAYVVKQFENSGLDALMNFDDEEQTQMGKELFNDITRDAELVNDHWAYPELVKILDRLTPHVARKQVTYRVNILNTPEINAFVTMGGYLYITTGLLDFVDSYDELAFIIGHELAHEDKMHTTRKVAKLSLYHAFFSMSNFEDYKNIALNIHARFAAPFDQIDEYEADKYGVEFARKAGYDVQKFDDFFWKLEKYQKKSLINKLLSTHPFAEHRKNCIQEYINQ